MKLVSHVATTRGKRGIDPAHLAKRRNKHTEVETSQTAVRSVPLIRSKCQPPPSFSFLLSETLPRRATLALALPTRPGRVHYSGLCHHSDDLFELCPSAHTGFKTQPSPSSYHHHRHYRRTVFSIRALNREFLFRAVAALDRFRKRRGI